MNYTQNNTITEQTQFMLPTVTTDCKFTTKELAKDMKGLQMNFPRVNIPSGGAL